MYCFLYSKQKLNNVLYVKTLYSLPEKQRSGQFTLHKASSCHQTFERLGGVALLTHMVSICVSLTCVPRLIQHLDLFKVV